MAPKVTLEGFKLCCISEEFTDEQVRILGEEVVIESEQDLLEFFAIIHKYRPALEKEFAVEAAGGKVVIAAAESGDSGSGV